jgi:hypothetical protein
MPIVSKYPFLFAQGFVDLADLARFIARTFADCHWGDYEEFSTHWQQPSINAWRTATVRDLPLKFTVQPLVEGFSFFHAIETMARCVAVCLFLSSFHLLSDLALFCVGPPRCVMTHVHY